MFVRELRAMSLHNVGYEEQMLKLQAHLKFHIYTNAEHVIITIEFTFRNSPLPSPQIDFVHPSSDKKMVLVTDPPTQ